MFGMGWPEIFVIVVVALIVFGPERLPEMAKQAAQTLKALRRVAEQAKNDIRGELGEDLGDLHLSDLDPRQTVREIFADVKNDIVAPPVKPQSSTTLSGKTPFDTEAT